MGALDGNGWVLCRCGLRHWGRHGAAGLLLHRVPSGTASGGTASGGAAPDGAVADAGEVLLQLRAAWTHQGGTWGLPGGAADSHEDAVVAALREAHEEAGVRAGDVDVLGTLVTTDHGDWRYTTVLARLTDPDAELGPANEESEQVCWTPLAAVADLDLHAGFACGWPRLRERLGALLTGTAGPPPAPGSSRAAR